MSSSEEHTNPHHANMSEQDLGDTRGFAAFTNIEELHICVFSNETSEQSSISEACLTARIVQQLKGAYLLLPFCLGRLVPG